MKSAAWLKLGVALLLSGVVSTQVWAVSEAKKQAIAERIKPVGSVCVEGDSACASASAAAGGAARSGEEIYNASCTACHSTGAAGAPKIGDAADWGKRLADKGLDTLHDHAVKGFNGMPPMGLCMSCSADEIHATVDYILEKSK